MSAAVCAAALSRSSPLGAAGVRGEFVHSASAGPSGYAGCRQRCRFIVCIGRRTRPEETGNDSRAPAGPRGSRFAGNEDASALPRRLGYVPRIWRPARPWKGRRIGRLIDQGRRSERAGQPDSQQRRASARSGSRSGRIGEKSAAIHRGALSWFQRRSQSFVRASRESRNPFSKRPLFPPAPPRLLNWGCSGFRNPFSRRPPAPPPKPRPFAAVPPSRSRKPASGPFPPKLGHAPAF